MMLRKIVLFKLKKLSFVAVVEPNYFPFSVSPNVTLFGLYFNLCESPDLWSASSQHSTGFCQIDGNLVITQSLGMFLMFLNVNCTKRMGWPLCLFGSYFGEDTFVKDLSKCCYILFITLGKRSGKLLLPVHLNLVHLANTIQYVITSLSMIVIEFDDYHDEVQNDILTLWRRVISQQSEDEGYISHQSCSIVSSQEISMKYDTFTDAEHNKLCN